MIKQALVLTGESGSGKTEAGKLVLQYIAAVTGHAQVGQDLILQPIRFEIQSEIRCEIQS